MGRKKKYLAIAVLLMMIGFTSCKEKEEDIVLAPPEGGYQAIAYVTVPASDNWRWIGTDGEEVVSYLDTRYVTHVNFAFGMIEAYQFDPQKPGRPLMDGEVASKEAYQDQDGEYHYKATVQGWIEEMDTKVDGRKYLHALVKKRAERPDLKVLLSIGGWDSDGFCYMAQTKEGRAEFIESCLSLIEEYDLDGIDLDWEYPVNGGWGAIASCDRCVEDAKELLKEFRVSLNQKYNEDAKLLTIASGLPWVDEETMDALDYINVMCYDYQPGSGQSQSSMEYTMEWMENHSKMTGDTKENNRKLHIGLPFYNEGGPYLVPSYKEWDGYVDASPEHMIEKLKWLKKEGYGGAFYWAYSMDTFLQDVKDPQDPKVKILQRTLYETLNGKVE